ncbi:MAG: ABC transporter ATP-binding protein [Eubacteriales bacterium]|nr:ABC transporter ATP-binding protein [Eubacteriales bacterium]
MIEARAVSFAYADAEAVRECSVQLRKGLLYAIIGPNGSGKSTLLRLLSNLALPKSGRLLLKGREYASYERREFARSVALMPQTRSVPEMTVREYVEHGRYPFLPFSQRFSAADRAAVEKALIETEMSGFAERFLRELSGGERQRAYLALLLAQDPKFALLDEPTTFLDISAQFQVMEILRRMRDEGRCVVAVLHDLSMAMQFCDRIIVMSEGKIIANEAPDDLAASHVWEEVFGIRCMQICMGNDKKYLFEPKK